MLLAAGLLACAAPASAHAPEGLTLVFEKRLDILTVTVRHNVKDTATHHIESIEVWVNGAEAIHKTYSTQPGNSFILRLKLDVVDGDKVLVRANCNINGSKEQSLTVGPGITEAGTNAGRVKDTILVHAGLQTTALVVALAAMPGGWGFYSAWRNKQVPKGRRRLHARLGGAAVGLWALGAVGGFLIVHLTSGDYLGSQHGWLAFTTFGAAAIAAYAASPSFRKAGYGTRIPTHIFLVALAVAIAVATMVMGLMASGLLG
jgi:hypothetical protein